MHQRLLLPQGCSWPWECFTPAESLRLGIPLVLAVLCLRWTVSCISGRPPPPPDLSPAWVPLLSSDPESGLSTGEPAWEPASPGPPTVQKGQSLLRDAQGDLVFPRAEFHCDHP